MLNEITRCSRAKLVRLERLVRHEREKVAQPRGGVQNVATRVVWVIEVARRRGRRHESLKCCIRLRYSTVHVVVTDAGIHSRPRVKGVSWQQTALSWRNVVPDEAEEEGGIQERHCSPLSWQCMNEWNRRGLASHQKRGRMLLEGAVNTLKSSSLLVRHWLCESGAFARLQQSSQRYKTFTVCIEHACTPVLSPLDAF